MHIINTALKENRCTFCGTEHGKQVKVVNEVYQVRISLRDTVPVCNICAPFYPLQIRIKEMDFVHITWEILQKRLNQHEVFSRICKCGCGAPIVTARKEKEFVSNSCRARYWQRQKLLKEKGANNGTK